MRARILVVDGDCADLETLCRGLFVCGHEVVAARDVDHARELVTKSRFDLVVADVKAAPEADALRELHVPLLLTTGVQLDCGCLSKPFTPDELDAAVHAALGIDLENAPTRRTT